MAFKARCGMSRNAQVLLSALPPIQVSRITARKSELYSTLVRCLRPYLKRVLEAPERVEAAAEELVRDEKVLPLLYYVFQGAVLKLTEEDIKGLAEAFKSLGEKFKAAGADVEDALDMIVEHDVWKLRQIGGDFDEYAMMFYTFSTSYPGDAYRYAVILLSLCLLLLASSEAEASDRLKAVGGELSKLAEELETYTLTFMLMSEEREGGRMEAEAAATARTPRELREFLGIE